MLLVKPDHIVLEQNVRLLCRLEDSQRSDVYLEDFEQQRVDEGKLKLMPITYYNRFKSPTCSLYRICYLISGRSR
jgi:hypothetical protein